MNKIKWTIILVSLLAIGATITVALVLILHDTEGQSKMEQGPREAPPIGWKPSEDNTAAKVMKVGWEKFPELLSTGEVVGGVSLHDGYVELQMKDGRRYSSTCPEGESLPELMEKHAPNHDIPIVME